MTITEEDCKEMHNYRQLKTIPKDENLLNTIIIAVHMMDKNIIIKDFPLTEGFYHPFASYKKPKFQKPSDEVVNRLNTFISGMVAYYNLNVVGHHA